MFEFIKYLIIGFIQGIAEVLPISSSGHLEVLGHMLGLSDHDLALEVFLHLASLIAVIAFLYKRLIKLVHDTWCYLFKKQKEYLEAAKYFLYIIIATIPVVLFTIVMKLIGYQTSPIYLIGISFIINALMLGLLSKIKGHKKQSEMTFKDATIIGLFQCIGIFPGISRSGSCLNGASYRKIDKEDAANFAFMLFVPAAIGAFVLEFKDISLIFTLDQKTIACYLGAFVVATITTYLAFKFLLQIIKKGKLAYFSIYCIIIGIITIIYSVVNGWI